MSSIVVKIMKTFAVLAVFVLAIAVVLPASDSLAQADKVKDGIAAAGGSDAQPLSSVIKTVVNLLLYFVGALAVIMIIFGGFKYVTSAGESSGVSSAKNTIMYALIGLVISVLAFTIVNFAAGLFNNQPADYNDHQPETDRRPAQQEPNTNVPSDCTTERVPGQTTFC